MRWTEMVVICLTAVVIALGIVLAQPLQAWWNGRAPEMALQASPTEPAVADARTVGSVASPSPATADRSPEVPAAPLTTWTAQAPQRAEAPVRPPSASTPPASTSPVNSQPAGDRPTRPSGTVTPAPTDREARPASAPAASSAPSPGTRAAPGTVAPVLSRPSNQSIPRRPEPGAAEPESTVSQGSPRIAGPANSPARNTPAPSTSARDTTPAAGLRSAPSERPPARAADQTRTAVQGNRPVPTPAQVTVATPPRRDAAPRPATTTQVQPPRRVAAANSADRGGQIEVVVPRSPLPAPAPEARTQPRVQPSAPVRTLPELAADDKPTADAQAPAVDELVANQAATEAQGPDRPIEAESDPAAEAASLPAALDARGQGRALTALLEQGQWNDLWARLTPGAQSRWGDVAAFQAVWAEALGQEPRLLAEAVVEDKDGASYSRVVVGDDGESWSVDLRLDAAGTVQDIQIVPAP